MYSSILSASAQKYLSDFANASLSTISEVEKNFLENFTYFKVQFDEAQLPVFLYVARYSAKMVSAKLQCIACEQLLDDESDALHDNENDVDHAVNAYFEKQEV